MQNNGKHQLGIEHFQNGAYADAVRLFGEALLENENCELWNDWATAQAATGHIEEAKKGYRRALQLNNKDCQSAANLGVLLCGEGKTGEAAPLLEQSLHGLDEQQRQAVEELLGKCRDQHVALGKRAVGT